MGQCDELFETYQPLAAELSDKFCAMNFITKYLVPDMQNSALLGLWKAAKRWGECRDESLVQDWFRFYATRWINGCMKMELRRLAHKRGLVFVAMPDEIVAPKRASDDGEMLELVAKLRRQYQAVLERRSHGYTLDAVGAEMGCTKQYVAQLESKARMALHQHVRLRKAKQLCLKNT